jgi:hypothetical protein
MHPVEHKLKYVICPYLITAQRLKKWRPMQVYTFYFYCGEIFVLLAGFGLANPIVAFLAHGELARIPEYSSDPQTIIQFLGSGYSAALGILLLLTWGILKIYIRKEELEKRCNLLRSCLLQCSQFTIKVRSAIDQGNPMPALTDIHLKLSDLVERNSIERAWPYDGPEPGIQKIVNDYCDEMIAPFKEHWEEPPDQRRKP